VWTQEEVHGVENVHQPTQANFLKSQVLVILYRKHAVICENCCQGMGDKVALGAVRFVRRFFDTLTGYSPAAMTKEMVMNRVIFLETVAGGIYSS